MTSVLHVLDHSLPEQDGYSFRSHAILTNLQHVGVDVCALTSPKHGAAEADAEEIDGIAYVRSLVGNAVETSGVFGQLRTMQLTRRALRAEIRARSAHMIHAHSPCLNGLAAIGLGLPLVYEMRSSWEDAAVSVGTTREGSLRYKLSRQLETWVARRADEVVVICEGLRTELVLRGIRPEKISVMPNALPESMFVQPEPAAVDKVRERHSLVGKKVVGFFGSFFEWEGVDTLIRAMPLITGSVPEAVLLIAGGGRQEPELRELVSAMGLQDCVAFAGRVAHNDIAAYYAAADVMAYPRLPDRLTDMVTPLKPLEAMAQGIPVVASDVGGHSELVDDGQTGLLFEAGNREGLAEKIVAVLHGEIPIDKIVSKAKTYVRHERRWAFIAGQYIPLYKRLQGAQIG